MKLLFAVFPALFISISMMLFIERSPLSVLNYASGGGEIHRKEKKKTKTATEISNFIIFRPFISPHLAQREENGQIGI